MTDCLACIVLPAGINVVCTALVFAVALRRRGTALALSLLIFALGTLGLTFWPQAMPRAHSLWFLFFTACAIVGVTWVPGSLLAVIGAGRQPASRTVFAGAAVLVSGLLGAGFFLTALAFVCSILGDCL